ncbi:ABC transporter permease subunit [Candidatus Dependentiae bacterium]|nr:ABC transporter permease subunit [Candidatus Dependentiae bacterium]
MNIVRKIFKEELPFLFACPALIWQLFFVYLPLIVLLFYSFWNREQVSKFFKFSFVYYSEILNFLYVKVIINSVILAFITAIISLIIAYPVAYFFAIKVKRFKTFLLFSLILPSWTSFIVQIYAWFFLLQKDSLFSIIMYKLGFISKSSHLLNDYGAILVGMVYCFLPFMILPIYTVLEKMDKKLLEVSADLGANQIQTFKKIILPLSFPGIVAGFLLVFIPSFGEFAVPDLLGGGKTVLWGSLIVEKFLVTKDWHSGATLTIMGILLLSLTLMFGYIINYFFKKIVRTKI